jgi:hypothetical protein
MIRLTALVFVMSVFSGCFHGATAQVSKELVRCREARIVIRSAADLAQSLTELNITPQDATDYLTALRRSVDECETNSGNQISTIPRFPSQSLTGVGTAVLIDGPVVAGPGRNPTAGGRHGFPDFMGPAIFSRMLEEYFSALAAQCGASLTLAYVATSKPIFDSLIDQAAFGRCPQNNSRGQSGNQLPLTPSFSSAEQQCHMQVLKALQKLAIDKCPKNPLAADGAPTKPEIKDLDKWKKDHPPQKDVIPLNDGHTITSYTYRGLDDRGYPVKIVDTVETDRQGAAVSTSSDVDVKNLSDGTSTHIYEKQYANGAPSESFVKVTDKDNNEILTYRCDPPNCDEDPHYGPSHPTNLDDTRKRADDIDDAWKYAQRAKLVYDIIKIIVEEVFPVLASLDCARFPGNDTTKLYYKDDRGVEIDIAGMVHQCSCQTRAKRCPLCTELGMILPATSCESEKERKRRECLVNPFGPNDEVRKECIAALQEDNPGVNLDALFCSRVRCPGNRASTVTLSSKQNLSCGCFAPPAEFAPGLAADAVCRLTRCETGECRCEIVEHGRRRTCGCVVSAPTGSSPHPPPTDVHFPVPVPPPGPGGPPGPQ